MRGIYKSTSLEDLPDEIFVNIFSNFDVIRSFETQSAAFRSRGKERQRQRENRERQITLRSLCLTSKRAKRIAEPILYSACIGTCTLSGLKPLRLFIRSIQNEPALRHAIRYVENRTSDYRGNSLYEDTDSHHAVDRVNEYFFSLATIIKLCPNLVDLSLVSIETDNISLWEDLLFDERNPVQIAGHGLLKLETLCFQILTTGWVLQSERGLFQRITDASVTLPKLRRLCANGPVSYDVGSPAAMPAGRYKSLEMLDLSNCVLEFDELLQMTSMCKALKHFGCHWAYLDTAPIDLSQLHRILSRHQISLEHFHLDTREVRSMDDHGAIYNPFGNLQVFKSLTTIEIDEGSLLATGPALLRFPEQPVRQRISTLLPTALESLTLFLSERNRCEDGCPLDEVSALWDLAEDCRECLPNLHTVTVQSTFRHSAPELTVAFDQAGINLVMKGDDEVFN